MRNLIRPAISIIIPAYNEGKTLPHLFASLNKQVSKNFQVVCVDNNSTDNTIEVIKKNSKNLPFPLYLVREVKPGPGNARRAGSEFVINQLVNASSSPSHILATTDADCEAPPNWTQVIQNTFKSNCGIAGGSHTAKPVIDEKINTYLGIKQYFGTIAHINEFLAENQIGKIKLSGPNSAVRIDAYLAAGGYNQPLNSDGSIGVKELTDLGSRVINANYQVSFIHCPIYSSRRRHLKELIENSEMYYCDKKDKDQRFISIRDSETKLLNISLKTIRLTRWKQYQDLLIYKVVYNMIFKPALDDQLDLSNLKKIGFSNTKVETCKNLLKSISPNSQNFWILYKTIPNLFEDISVAVKNRSFTKST